LKKRFITNLGLLLLLNLLIKPFWIFGIDRSVQNITGTENYGMFFSLLSFSLLLNIIPDFGISNFNNRETARDHQSVHNHFSSFVALKIVLSVIYILCLLTIALLLNYDNRQLYLLMFLALNQILSSFILYVRSNISGMQYFKTDSFLSVLDRTFMIIICMFLLWGQSSNHVFRIEWFVYAQTVSYILALLISLITLLSLTGRLSLHLQTAGMISILRRCVPFALLTLLMAVYYRIDSVMLERLLPDGPTQAGIYAQAFRITDALIQFAVLFATLLLPMYSKMIKQKERVDQLTTLAFNLLLFPSVILVVAAGFCCREIMDMLYHSTTPWSGTILVILLVNYLFICVSYIFGTLHTANGNIGLLNRIAAAMVAINIVLNLVLIPRWQVMGAAVASLITQASSALLQTIFAFRWFKFSISKRKSALFLLFILLLMTAGFGFRMLSLPTVAVFGGTLSTGLGLAILFGHLNPRLLSEIWNARSLLPRHADQT